METIQQTASDTTATEKVVELKVLLPWKDNKIKLSLFWWTTPKWESIWFQKFIYEDKIHTFVLNSKYTIWAIKFENWTQKVWEIKHKERKNDKWETEEFAVVNIGKFNIFLNKSQYEWCAYYASVKATNEEVDVDFSEINSSPTVNSVF